MRDDNGIPVSETDIVDCEEYLISRRHLFQSNLLPYVSFFGVTPFDDIVIESNLRYSRSVFYDTCINKAKQTKSDVDRGLSTRLGDANCEGTSCLSGVRPVCGSTQSVRMALLCELRYA